MLVFAAVMTPLLGYLGPLGFAALLALVGLVSLPQLRLTDEDRPIAAVLLIALVWAAMSTVWSPYRPSELEENTALKLALQLVLYAAAVWGARRADPAQRRLALVVLAWGLAAWGVVLLIEAATFGRIYQFIRDATGDPIRPDLGRKNIAQGVFALALLWPVAAAAGYRAGAPAWLAAPMAAGTLLAAWRFGADAPVIAVPLGLAVFVLVCVRPRGAPRVLGVVAALFFLLVPLAMLALRAAHLRWEAPASWAQRMGYWSNALEGIAWRPLQGWGLDASRVFPGITLHPHNAPLQLWLELGMVGAALAAIGWALMLRRLSREQPSLIAAAAAASAAVYLLFGAVSFGVWQEWWLALGALVAVITALADGLPARAAARPSTRPTRVG